MKLHLPKRLLTALLSALVLSSPETKALNELGISREGNFWANDYAFSFILNDNAFKSATTAEDGSSTIVIAAYWGGSEMGSLGSNAILATRDDQGAITLKIGRGTKGAAGDLTASSTYTVEDNSQTFSLPLTTGTVYTLKVAGASGAMDPVIYAIASNGKDDPNGTYGGNMNGNAQMNSAFNDNVAILVSGCESAPDNTSGTATLVQQNTLVWAGIAAESETSATWGTWNSIAGTGAAEANADSVLYFDASTAVAKTVDVSGDITVGNIHIFDNYTFNATEATTLTTSSGLTVASGKKFTINGDKLTINGPVSFSAGSTLALNAESNLVLNNAGTSTSNTFTLGNITNSGTMTVNGPVAFIAGSVLTLNDNSELILTNAGEVEFNSYNSGVGITTTGDSGIVTIGSGTTAKLTNTHQKGQAAIDGIIKVLGGGKLLLAHGTDSRSLLGHSNLEDATNAIYLKGDNAENMAVMEIATNKAQHLTTNLYLQGNAQITDSTAENSFALLECYGGNITVTGAQNTIAASLFVNKNVTVNISGALDELTITGQLLSDSTDDVLTKDGAGTLILAGDKHHGLFYSSGYATISPSETKLIFKNLAGTTNIIDNASFHTLNVQGGILNVNSDVTVKNTLTLNGGNLLTVAKGKSLTLDVNKEITFSNESMITGEGTVHVMNSTTLTLAKESGTASVSGSTIHVHGGGLLKLNGDDRLGWKTNATGAILLAGNSESNVATLQLGGRQTMTTALIMQGNALVSAIAGGADDEAGGLNAYKKNGATITVTGKNNVIEAILYRRDAFLIDVTNADDELEVKGNVVTQDGGAEGTDEGLGYDSGSIVKQGAGKLTFSGNNNTFDRKFLHQAGTTILSGTAVFSADMVVQSGKFETNGSATMSGAISNSGTFAVSGGTTTIGGEITNNGAIIVSSGTATINGNVSNNNSITVSGGTAEFTNTLGMGSDSSLSVSGGAATVSNVLNVTGTGVQIVQSGDGILNLTGQMSIAENASATLSGAITLGHTITNDGNLTLNGTIYISGNIDTTYKNRGQGGSSFVLFDADGTASEGDNGFMQIKGASYWLTQSTEGVTSATNTIDDNFATFEGKDVIYHGETAYEVHADNGQLYFSTGDIISSQFYINSGVVLVDDLVQNRATGYTLQSGTMKLQGGTVQTSNITYTDGNVDLTSAATLIIDVADGSENATHWLTETTGAAGTSIDIAANANFGEVSTSPSEFVTSFRGKWVVSNDATLKLGGLNDGTNTPYSVNLLSLESLDLNGGNLRFFGDSAQLGQVNVKQVSRFDIYEMYDDDSLLNITNLNLGATLTMDTGWRSHVNIEALTGSGRLVLESGSTLSTFKATVTDGYTGVLDLNHITDKMHIELNVAANATATIEGDKDVTINKLIINNKSSFNIDTNGANNAGKIYTLGSVNIVGSSTIQTTTAHNGWQAKIDIASLISDADAELNIISNTKTTQRSIININGGDFDGIINITGSSSNADRKIALNVNHSSALADSVVRMHGNGSHVALAIGGEEGNSITLKGIHDQEKANGTMVIVSGAQAYGTNADFLSASEYDSRTLVIDTDGSKETGSSAIGGTFSTNATISAGINIQKEGNGQQTFSGDLSRFDGSVMVHGGTLAFTGTGNLTASSVTISTNSNLKLGSGTSSSARKLITFSSINAEVGSQLYLGDYATLKITEVPAALKSEYSGGNNDASSSVSLSITGGIGSVLDLAMDSTDFWKNNNTVTLVQGENSGLTVRISSGYLANSVFAANNNVYTTTNLGGSALSMADGTSLVLRRENKAENFGSGDITLEGTTNLNVYGSVSKGNTTLTNNISNAAGKAGTLNITNGPYPNDDKNDTSADGGITLTGNLNLTKLSNQAREEVELSGESMQFGTLEVNSSNGSTTTISGNATADSVSVQQGTLSVTADAELNLGDTATITAEESKTASMEKVQLSEEGIASADETKATKGSVTDAKVTLAALAEGTSFSIEDVTLTNVNIEAENADDRVNLSGVSATDVQLTKGEFHMLDTAQPQVVGTGGSAINPVEGVHTDLQFSTSLLNGMTLRADASMVVDLGDLSGFTGMDSGKPTFSITLNGFSIEGFKIGDFLSDNPGIYFAADSWLGQLLVAQGASQYVKGDTLEAGAQATAGSGSGVSVSYNSTAVGTVIIISGLQVPEPTTSTLGLIALSALAMRRRRK